MAEKTIFYINNFEVDVSRSILIKDGHQTQVEPKVLKVLLLLAQRQNKVVTHQEIMAHVWQGTDVVPNALQRCIAILRKELGDDAKSPRIIKTHPRIGYRLLAEVRWQEQPARLSVSEILAKDKNARIKTRAGLMLILAVSLLIVLASVFWLDNKRNHGSLKTQYTKVKPITQTDAHESHVIYSPDTQYLIFNRYAGLCKGHIWARHLESGKESQLTSQPGNFGELSFTGGGRELVFAANNQCDKTANYQEADVSKQSCWSLATLDFSLSLTASQDPVFRYQCQADSLKTPKALPNHQYVFLQFDSGRYRLMHYNDLSKTVKPFYTSQNQYIYHFDYDPENRRFAVFSQDDELNTILELLNESGQVYRREIIKLTAEMSRYQRLSGNFEPQGEYLLAVSNNRLYKISFDGQLQLIQTPTPNLISVVKHPIKDTLLAIQGKKDLDVAKLTLAEENSEQINDDLNSVVLPFSSIARSFAQEHYALFQPEGERVAFISDRSGSDQLWIWHHNTASQLSYVTHQSKIESFSWSPDGTRLAWAANDKLLISDLNGNIQTFNLSKPVYTVLSWYQDNQFLVLLNDPQPSGLYHLDIEKNELTQFGVNLVEGAWVVQDQIVYRDTTGAVFIRSLDADKKENKRLSNLNGKAAFVAEPFIYHVDKNSFMLNQYDLEGQRIKPIIRLKEMAWKVTGLKGDELLLTQFISVNQDIMMLE